MSPEADAGAVHYIHPPNSLELEPGVGPTAPEAISRGESALQRLAGSYVDWAIAELARLHDLVGRTAEARSNRLAQIDAIYIAVHELRGLGTTLGYPLLSRIGHSLCRTIERDGAITDLKVITGHLDAMTVAIEDGIQGRKRRP